MKTIITILLTAAALIGVLRSDLKSWRLVNQADLKVPTPVVAKQRVPMPPSPPQNHSGAWMRDPNYHSPLERPAPGKHQGSSLQDFGKPTPTPPRRP